MDMANMNTMGGMGGSVGGMGVVPSLIPQPTLPPGPPANAIKDDDPFAFLD